MRNLSLLLAVALLAPGGIAFGGETSVDTALPPPADLRGVYVYAALDAKDGSAEAQAVDSALSLPGTDGMLLVGLWSSIEPSRGQFAWAALDHWVGRADSLGKKITLVIRAGDGIPSWLFLPPPSGAGVRPLTFTISPHEGKTGQCDTETIAPP